MNPLDELKSLDRQIDEIRELAALKPIFYRLDAIAKEHADDFEVQLSAGEVKQRVVARGTTLRALGQTLQGRAEPGAGSGAFQPFGTPTGKTTTPINIPRSGADQNNFPNATSSFEQPVFTPPVDLRETVDAGLLPGIESHSNMEGADLDGASLRPMAPPRTEAPFPVPQSGNPMKRALLVGGLVGGLIALGLIGFLVNRNRTKKVAITALPLAVVTVPDGASIRINGEAKCISNCSIALTPGDYQVTAFLDGYEPASGAVRVSAKQPAELSLTFTPQGQTIRIVSDVAKGQVTMDDRMPVDLQDGQFVLDKVTPGTHQVKVTSSGGEASFAVEIAGAALPKIAGPVSVKDFTALLVSSVGSRAHVVASAPAKLAVNGQDQGTVGPDGIDVKEFKPGVGEFVVGDGQNKRTMSETFGPSPTLTVFLKADVAIGTLIVSTGEDDARVFFNGKEYARKTKKGELRIQTLGPVSVRVAKDGFEVAPTQNGTVAKGAETRLAFNLVPIPRVGNLQIHGATAGAEVLIDQKPVGTVGDDGNFTANGVAPGEHTVEVRKDQFVGRRFQRTFQAGLSVTLANGEATLLSAVGSVRLNRSPADAVVSYRKADETQLREVRGNQMDLAPGTYIFVARSPGFMEKTERVQVAMGEAHAVELSLTRAITAAAPPVPKGGGIGDFDDANAWSKQGDLWVHKGAGFIPYRLPANGTFTFTVRLLKGGSLFRGGRIRWAVQYMDAKNYALFELDRKNLASKVLDGGKLFDREKYAHGLSDKEMSYTMQIDIAPGQLIHRVKNGEQWMVLDTWKEPGRNFSDGKFGFLVQGSDEIGLTDFKFVPR